jgi:hypothetical protein
MKTRIVVLGILIFATIGAMYCQNNDNRIYIDTLWGFALAVPNNFISKPFDKYFVNLNPDGNLFKGITYSIDGAKRYLNSVPAEERPKFNASRDSVKEIALSIVREVRFVKTAESNIEYSIDSVNESKTNSGLRYFSIYQTEVVDSYPSGSSTSHLSPFFIVVLPTHDDYIFLNIRLKNDEPSKEELHQINEIVKSTGLIQCK